MARGEIHQLITELGGHSAYPSISIYVPTHRTMPERKQDPIRVKDLISQATDRLLNEFEKRDILPYLKKLEDLADSVDYTRVLDGLVFFVNKDVSRLVSLPFSIKEKVVIDKAFALRDLVRGYNRLRPYWALVVSEGSTRLFQGAGKQLDEVIDDLELQENSQGFPFKLNYDVTSERVRFAVGTGDRGVANERGARKRFMEDLDVVLHGKLQDTELPLIIAGTDDNRAVFKEVTRYIAQIVGEYPAEAVRLSAHDLEPFVRPIFEEWYRSEQEKALHRFREAVGDRQAVYGIKELFRRAWGSEIHQLLVEEGFSVPGTLSADDPPQVVLYEESTLPGISDDLVDHLIEAVRQKGGSVLFVPKGSLSEYDHIGAVLRF